jgi:hypothetical protein
VWNTTGSLVATAPPQNPKCTGAQRTITLTPYGVRCLAEESCSVSYCSVRPPNSVLGSSRLSRPHNQSIGKISRSGEFVL